MDIIGSLQLRVMHHIWKHGPSTVHQVHDALNSQTDAQQLAYTTILTVMRNLAKREILDQKRTGRSHVFEPLVTEEDYKRGLLRHICQSFFAGDHEHMIGLLQAEMAGSRV
ncbi:MAG: BlaI/MecI/CopY family transcriptional regulator [Planctomycetota bacterium]